MRSGGFQNVEAPNVRTSVNVVRAKPIDVDVKVAEFPKLVLIHGILLSLLI